MPESTLSYALDDLQKRVKRFLGITAVTLSEVEAADVEDCIQSGLRQFYWPPAIPGERRVHRWSFMKLPLSVDSAADAWEIDLDDDFGNLLSDRLFFDNDESQSHYVKLVMPQFIDKKRQYDEDSTGAPVYAALRPVAAMEALTGTGAINEATPLDGMTAFGVDTLVISASDIVTVGQRFTIAGETTLGEIVHTVTAITPADGLTTTTDIEFTPALATARGIPANSAVITFTSLAEGQRYQLIIYPQADAVYTMTGWYEPALNKLTTALPWPFGGVQHTETIIESVLSIAEQRLHDERGLHFARFLERLTSSVSLDRQRGPRNYGYNDSNEYGRLSGRPDRYVLYNGVRYDNR